MLWQTVFLHFGLGPIFVSFLGRAKYGLSASCAMTDGGHEEKKKILPRAVMNSRTERWRNKEKNIGHARPSPQERYFLFQSCGGICEGGK